MIFYVRTHFIQIIKKIFKLNSLLFLRNYSWNKRHHCLYYYLLHKFIHTVPHQTEENFRLTIRSFWTTTRKKKSFWLIPEVTIGKKSSWDNVLKHIRRQRKEISQWMNEFCTRLHEPLLKMLVCVWTQTHKRDKIVCDCFLKSYGVEGQVIQYLYRKFFRFFNDIFINLYSMSSNIFVLAFMSTQRVNIFMDN